MNKKMEWVKCSLCGSEDFSLLFEGWDYRCFSPLTFKVVKCNNCRLVCLNPRPKEIIQYYPERSKSIVKDSFLFLKPNRAKIIKNLKKEGRILDIGCGEGGFLFDIHKEGWEVYGNDISKTACDFARKKLGSENIYHDDLLSLNFSRNFFDIVTMWHTLEHIKKPRATLKKVHGLLKDDGILIVECPNFSNLQSRFFKEKSFALNLPRHFYQFTPKTLEKLLKLTGFKIYKRDYIIDVRITFIVLKISLLRWLGVQRVPNRRGEEEPPTVVNFRKNRIIWRLARFVVNISCILLSLFLILINSDTSFRVYCKKINEK